MERVVSGIRSTGNLHLGNYYGALVNFLKMQKEQECFFLIADLHSLTTHPKPGDFYGNVKQVLAQYIAAGLDPDLSTIFVQSDVPEISELYVILNMLAYVGELERTTSFKDKIRQQPDNVNAGLLTYPVLMATDILIHKATKVPVGKDQEQHLEMTRVYARRFNHFYGTDLFPEPDAFNFGSDLIKIPGLDGSGKMGKSEGNGIFLVDDDKTIRKKLSRAVTDAGPTTENQEMCEPVANLFTILKVVSSIDTYNHFLDQYNNCSIRYGDLKKQIAEDIITISSPIRTQIEELKKDDARLEKIRRLGCEKARESASKTLQEVRKIVGFKNIH